MSDPKPKTSRFATPVTVKSLPVVRFPATATVELLALEFGVTVMCDTYVSASFLSFPKLRTPLSATFNFQPSPGSSP